MSQSQETSSGLMSLYEFEFRLLPYLVDLCSKGKVTLDSISDKESIRRLIEINSLTIEWNWDDFICSLRMVSELPVVIYQFPEPEMAPLARFSAVVPHRGYYTLEMDDTMDRKTWSLCTQSTAQHTLICEVDDCADAEEFIALLQRKKIIRKERKSFFSFLKEKFF